MKYISMILVFALLVCIPMYGQNELSRTTIENYKYAEEVQLWKSLLNPAGLSRDTLIVRGQTSFGFSTKRGGFHRVQEGSKNNELSFFSEQYKRLGTFLYGYAHVNFEMGRIFERSWSDVMRTYDANPYISGSAIAGKYDYQNFGLTAKLTTLPLQGMTYGLRLDYSVGDLSRLKDPRSRSSLADYRLVPGITYNIGKHILGATAFYHRRKEKIPGVTTVQTDPTLKYYTFSGLEHAIGTTGGYSSFSREYVHHEFGGEFSYGYKTNRSTTVFGLFYNRGNEDVWEEMKYSPGTYETLDYGVRIHHLLKSNQGLHRVRMKIKYAEGAADQLRQEKVTVKDPVTGISSSHWETLIKYNNRYLHKALDLDFAYRYMWLDRMSQPLGYMGLKTHYYSVKKIYNPPYSIFRNKFLHLDLELGYGLRLKEGCSLWIEPNLVYHHPLSTNLQLHDVSTDYAVSVLLPDMRYYGSKYAQAGLQLNYQWSMDIKKYKAQCYAKAKVDYLKAQHNKDNTYISLTLGLLH